MSNTNTPTQYAAIVKQLEGITDQLYDPRTEWKHSDITLLLLWWLPLIISKANMYDLKLRLSVTSRLLYWFDCKGTEG